MKNLFYFRALNDLKNNFYDVICSLNIELVDFVIDELNIDINVLFSGWTILQRAIVALYVNPNDNNIEFAYEMFDHLLKIGADIKKLDYKGKDIDNYIDRIRDEDIKNNLKEMIQKHIKSKYYLTKGEHKSKKEKKELCDDY